MSRSSAVGILMPKSRTKFCDIKPINQNKNEKQIELSCYGNLMNKVVIIVASAVFIVKHARTDMYHQIYISVRNYKVTT